MSSGSVVTSGGHLNGGSNWLVTTVVSADEASVTISVQLPGGVKGYTTDILHEFARDDTVRKYAHHALTTIYKRNNWNLTDPQEYREYFILDTATSTWGKEKFYCFEAAEAYMKDRGMKGYIISDRNNKTSETVQRDFTIR